MPTGSLRSSSDCACLTDEETDAQRPEVTSPGHMAVSSQAGFQVHGCLSPEPMSLCHLKIEGLWKKGVGGDDKLDFWSQTGSHRH